MLFTYPYLYSTLILFNYPNPLYLPLLSIPTFILPLYPYFTYTLLPFITL